jgi:hypothetical protein
VEALVPHLVELEFLEVIRYFPQSHHMVVVSEKAMALDRVDRAVLAAEVATLSVEPEQEAKATMEEQARADWLAAAAEEEPEQQAVHTMAAMAFQ